MEWISQCQTELVQQGSELFIVDNSDDDWKAVRYVRDWCQISKSIDIATGYFDIGSLLSLGDEWQKVDKIRILMGEEASLRTKKAFQEGLSTATNRFDNSLEDEKGRNIFLMTGGCTPLSASLCCYLPSSRMRGLSSNGTEMYAKGVDRYLPEMRLRRIHE